MQAPIQPNQSSAFHQANPLLVSVYFRLSSKKGIKVKVPTPANLLSIGQLIQAHFGLDINSQIIYFSSVRYKVHESINLDLQEGSILHIHSETNDTQRIKIYLKEAKPVNQNDPQVAPTPYSIMNTLKIQDFIHIHLEKENLLLVESGRWLDPSKSFKDQNVENQATISFINRGKELDHEEFQKDFNNLFDEEEESKKQALARIKEERQKILESKRMRKRQISSSEEKEKVPILDFKKKNNKYISFTAVKVNPQDIDYTWKVDRSVSENPNKHMIKKLKRSKKARREEEEAEKMSITQRQKLREQVKKLFMPEHSGMRVRSMAKTVAQLSC